MARIAVPWEQLFKVAAEVRRHAHAPYSKFRVGTAVYLEGGEVVSGCNVENASYGLSICGERAAIFRAIAEVGRRKLLAVAIVINSAAPCPPCGACRQVMAEFADPWLPVRSRNLRGQEARYLLKHLLPHAFTNAYF